MPVDLWLFSQLWERSQIIVMKTSLVCLRHNHLLHWVVWFLQHLTLQKHLFYGMSHNNFIIHCQDLISNFDSSILETTQNKKHKLWILLQKRFCIPCSDCKCSHTFAAAPWSVKLLITTPLIVSSSLMAIPKPPWSWGKQKNANG